MARLVSAVRAARRAVRTRFASCEAGGVTVEFVLWVPLFALFLLTMTDVTLNVAHRANVERATMETVYALSRRQITVADAESYLREKLHLGDPLSVNVAATLGNEAEVIVTKSERSATPLAVYSNMLEAATGTTMASSRMLVELDDACVGGMCDEN